MREQRHPAEVLEFWFGTASVSQEVHPRGEWFKKDAKFDDEIRHLFGETIRAGLVGDLSNWCNELEGAVALIVLLDQFTRNIWRGTERAFLGDPIAFYVANLLVQNRGDRSLAKHQRSFVYLPFEHSESLEEQKRSLQLFQSLMSDYPEDQTVARVLDYARQHYVIIERFRRFPHRNAQLGRCSTAEEQTFLETPNSSF